MEYISRLISSMGYRIYTIYPLSRLGWFFLFGLAGWTLVSAIVTHAGKVKLWRRINSGIAILFMEVLLYLTVVSRGRTSYGGMILRPFFSFYLAREENREYYREMLMNVFLFFPLGLTLPFGLSARKHPVLISLGIGILLSVCIETLQYVFSLGWAETDDVIMNALGVLIGSAAYGMASALEAWRQTRNNTGQDETHGE